MKKCPQCGAVSSDDQSQCDMCGGDLTDAPTETLDAIEMERTSDEMKEDALERATIRRAAERQRVIIITVRALGVVLLVVGLVLVFQLQPLYGLILILLGGSMILFGTSIWPYVGRGGWPAKHW